MITRVYENIGGTAHRQGYPFALEVKGKVIALFHSKEEADFVASLIVDNDLWLNPAKDYPEFAAETIKER
jgi:hypothetical protein